MGAVFLKRLFLASALLLAGAGVAVAAQYLNFYLECHAQGTVSCPSGAVIFQGSIDVTNATGDGNHTGTIILSSATTYVQPNGTYNGGIAQYPVSITGNQQVQYTCNNGLCHVSNVSFTMNYGTASFTFNGSTNPPDQHNGSITLQNGSGTEIGKNFSGNCVNGISGTGSASECNLLANPLSNPEIDGATLPKAILLLASLFIVVRSQKLVGKRTDLGEIV
jgi:hypothetical protein